MAKRESGALAAAEDERADAVESNFDFEEYVPFLIRRIAPYHDHLIAAEMELLGLNPEALNIMLVLQRHGPQSLGGLADLTSINLSTLSRLIGRMQKQKLVQRKPGAHGRTVEITLLPLGARKIGHMIPAMQGLQKGISQLLTPEELAVTKTALRQLYQVIVRISTDQGEPVTRPKAKRFRPLDGG
jgi:DNA-binding MarR family transcriptional regulator